MAVHVPPYFDQLIPAARAGRAGRDVHLGWWAATPTPTELAQPSAFARAQARLTARILALAELRDGLRVLDVGCGFGGTLATVNETWNGMALIGVNIDPRQLALCAEVTPRLGNELSWLQADALALPLADASVDRVLCVEAMFHFGTRRAFLREASRVLAPGGSIVVSDIVALPGATDDAAVQAKIEAGFGPWPDLWGRDADPRRLAEAAGLRCTHEIDASDATRPSHAFTAPPADARPSDPVALAAAALAGLHRAFRLKYPLLRFEPSAR